MAAWPSVPDEDAVTQQSRPMLHGVGVQRAMLVAVAVETHYRRSMTARKQRAVWPPVGSGGAPTQPRWTPGCRNGPFVISPSAVVLTVEGGDDINTLAPLFADLGGENGDPVHVVLPTEDLAARSWEHLRLEVELG